MNLALAIFVGGGIGSLCRYAMMNLISHRLPSVSFPWPTLSVNILGAFLIGILLELLALRTTLGSTGKFFLVTGFLGGFTTFSAFSLESALMFEKGDFINMGLYIAASVIGTVIAVFAGSGLIRSLT
jgi:CrcB protein